MSTPDIQMLILAWGWIPMVLFTFGYPIVARPWWRTQFGRAMEGSEISMAVLVGLSLASYWFHFILPDWAGTAILVLISTVAWMRFIALLSAQFRPTNSAGTPHHFGVINDGDTVSLYMDGELVWRGKAEDPNA